MERNITGTALLYSVTYLGITMLLQTTVKWYQYYYAPSGDNLGGLKVLVPLGIIGFTMVVARIFDGAANPIVAYYSDRCRSAMGRRKPFILFGSFPLVISYILIWFPPCPGVSTWNFIYLSLMLCLFFTFFTIVVDPYLALIGDISRSPRERIMLTTLQGVAQITGVMLAEAGSGILIKAWGFKMMGVTFGLVSLLTLMATPLFVKERILEESGRQGIGFLDSLKKSVANRNFLFYLFPCLAIWFGINTLTMAMPYMTENLLLMKAEYSGFLIAGAFVIAALSSPLLPSLTMRWGKKKTLLLTCLLFGIILCSTAFFGTLLDRNLSTFVVLLAGIPLAAALIVPNAMVADIAEEDGTRSGLRREGMFFGTQGLIQKLVIGLSSLVTPLLFTIFGCSRTSPLGLKLCGPVAGIMLLLSMLALRHYSLEES